MSASTTTPSLRERLNAVVSEAGPLQAARDVVKAVAVPRVDRERARAALVRSFAAEVEQSGSWPTDVVERWTAMQRELDEAQAVAEARWYVLEHLDGLATEAHTDALEPKLDVLRDELDEIVSRAAALDGVLGSARTADEAIGAGPEAIDAWRELAALVGRLAEVLRQHWRLVMRGTSGDEFDTYAATVPVRNGTEMHHVVDRVGHPVYLSADRLRAIASTEGLELWLPTLGELSKESDQRTTDPTPVRRTYGTYPIA